MGRFLFGLVFVISTGIILVSAKTLPILRGAVNQQIPPFIFKQPQAGNYSGFSVDLIERISALGNFRYLLFTSDNGYPKFGGAEEAVREGKADFAIGKLDEYPLFSRIFEFTEPIFTDQHLSAIVSRPNALKNSLCTVHDLLHPSGNEKNPLELWVINGIDYLAEFEMSNHSIVKRFDDAIEGDFHLELSGKALHNVLTEKYAIITDQSFAEYLVGDDCRYAILPDHLGLLSSNIVIYLQKHSPYLGIFNAAIRKLKDDGTIDRLRDKYWLLKCQNYDNCF